MWDMVLMYLKVFLVGGFICAIGQLLVNKTKMANGKVLVIILISGLVLQSFGLYQYVVDFAGAGATVPISGFGYLLAKGAIEGAKVGFVEAITGGVKAAALGLSVVLAVSYIVALIFKPRLKAK